MQYHIFEKSQAGRTIHFVANLVGSPVPEIGNVTPAVLLASGRPPVADKLPEVSWSLSGSLPPPFPCQ